MNLGINQSWTVYETFFRDFHFDLTPLQRVLFPESLDPIVVQKEALDYYKLRLQQQEDAIPKTYFEELLFTYHILNGAGAQVIIVEVPLPSWHQDSSKQFKAYALQKKSYYDQLKILGTPILDLKNDMSDSLFLDATHPLPQYAKKWSKLLANYLNEN